MTNVYSKPEVDGSFNISSLLGEERSQAQIQAEAEEEEARREAELEAAKNEYYERGKTEAAAEFEQTAEEIKNNSYELGYRSGKNEVLEELEPKYLAMKDIFDQWNEYKPKFLKELESDAIELALAIERKIVGRQIQKSKEPLKYVITEAMKMIKDRKNLRVRVSCEDEEYFKQGAMDFINTFGDDIEVIGDSNVNQSGCVIETSIGNVDAGMETRWNMIVDAFFTGIERGDNDIFKDMFAKFGEGESGPTCGEGDQDSGSVS